MYLFFDTETNGLPKNWKASVTKLSNWPRLVQLAWVMFDDKGNELEQNDYIIKPNGFTIPKEASKVHGITTEKAISEGVDIIDVLIDFNSKILKSSVLVAHNISFDEKIIGAELLRHNMEDSTQIKSKICTMKSTTNYVGISGYYGYKWVLYASVLTLVYAVYIQFKYGNQFSNS